MNNAAPTPVTFQDAIEKVVPDITCTNDLDVVIEDTLENDARITTIATLFNVPESKVEEAIVEEIQYQITLPLPDKELTDHLISEQREGFLDSGDER